MAAYVRYIDKTREYYLHLQKTGVLKSSDKPYRWAHFEDVPFAPLKKPLAESRVVLISTSEITARGAEQEGDDDQQAARGMYSLSADLPVEQLYSPSYGYDRAATTLEDVNAFYPTSALHEAVKSGRIGSLTKRFHGVYNAPSQRRTLERDAPVVLERCREDGADIAVIVPV